MLKAVSSESTQEESEEVKIPFQSVSEDIWDKKYRLKSKKGDFVDKNISTSGYGEEIDLPVDILDLEEKIEHLLSI